MTAAPLGASLADGSRIRVSLFGSSRRGARRRSDGADDRLRIVDGVSEFDLAAAFDRHGSAVLGFAINALRDRPLAEDCVQETFLRAWRARDRFDAVRGSERTWIFAIARNVVIDAARARRGDATSDGEDAERADDTAPWDPLEHLALIEGLALLSEDHRSVLTAVHLGGYSYAELALATGVPVATLRSRAHYALRALRAHLEEREPSDG